MFYCFIHNWYSSEEPCKVCCPLVTSTLSTSTIGTNSDEPPKPQAENKPDRDWQQVGYEAKLWVACDILSRIWFHGGFKIETANERTLAGILDELGLFPTTEEKILMRPDYDDYIIRFKNYRHKKLPPQPQKEEQRQTKKRGQDCYFDENFNRLFAKEEVDELCEKTFWASREKAEDYSGTVRFNDGSGMYYYDKKFTTYQDYKSQNSIQ